MRSSVLSVRQAAGALRAALLTPSLEGIEAVFPALQQAAVTLDQLRDQPVDPACRPDLEALSRELRVAAKLAAQGSEVAHGTLRLLAAAASGSQAASYQPDGEPAPIPTGAKVVVTG